MLSKRDIVLIPFSFTDLASIKVRPAVVISSDSVNQNSRDIIVAFISSILPTQIEPTDFLVTSSDPDFGITGLKKDSVFKMAKVVTLSKSLAQRKIGKVSNRIKAELDKRLRKTLGL